MKKLIKKILKEETEGMSPLEQTVADFINMNLSEYDLPKEFYKIAIDIYPDKYGRQECNVTMLFKKPFKIEDSDKLHTIMNKIKKDINQYFGDVFSYIGSGTSTIQAYNDYKNYYNQKKNLPF
jgi:hypothetical protein